jgi:3-hydroxy-9,10-secoandrosta-1,3,5(10)-triene-9,17-dione monooxygenase reductase component
MVSFDTLSFRRWFGGFATGVTVVTAGHKDGPVGITINSVTSVSLEPPLVLFCLDRKAHVYKILRGAKNFAVNILSEKQELISRHFADFRHHPAPLGIWDKSQKGAPVLKHTLGWMMCRQVAIHKAGDHDIVVGRTVALHRASGNPKPLLYFRGRYRGVGG